MRAVKTITRTETPPQGIRAFGVRSAAALLPPEIFRAMVYRGAHVEIDKTVENLRRNRPGALRFIASASHFARDTLRSDLPYTHRHSAEVGLFASIIVSELARRGIRIAEFDDLGISIATIAGQLHDIGKAWVPKALLVKELGVGFISKIWGAGARLSPSELDIVRKGHIDFGLKFINTLEFGNLTRVISSMVGCHHISFNGAAYDGFTSYPENYAGEDLQLYQRILKVCDVVSACLPRFYRPQNGVENLEDAIALAVLISGTQLDPLLVECLITGIYNMPQADARRLIGDTTKTNGDDWGATTDVSNPHISRTIEGVKQNPLFARYINKGNRAMLESHVSRIASTGSRSPDLYCARDCMENFFPLAHQLP